MSYQDLEKYMNKRMALNAALTLFEWDQETSAPHKSIDKTSIYIGELSRELFDTITSKDVIRILHELENDNLSLKEQAIVKHWLKDIERLEKIPADEYQAHSALLLKGQHVWSEAKVKNDYASFKPYLEKIFLEEKKFAAYRQVNNEPLYNILLNDYEPGLTMQELDQFFDELRNEIVPLLKAIQESDYVIDKSYNYKKYPIVKQKLFNKYIAQYVGFDFGKGIIKESEHPFTTNLHNCDVRITTHYYENNLESALFSTIHESGHATYEFNIPDDMSLTPIGVGTSMGMHESQSRFYENMIGRNPLFWKNLYPKLQNIFIDNLNDISFDQFMDGINKVEPSFIRTEADELTYPLHIMIRYEIEKKIFSEDVDFDELPKLWNEKYQEYLGITPQNDSEGILQDVHWSSGSIGYFPSYAVGSAVAAQIYAYMKNHTHLEKWIENGQFNMIKAYLGEHIHQYGAIYNTNELLIQLTGEAFNPKYYIEYLKDKYTKIYHLKR